MYLLLSCQITRYLVGKYVTGQCANKFTIISPDKTNYTHLMSNPHSLIVPNPMKLCFLLLPALVAITLGNVLPNTNSRLFFRSLNQEPPPPPSEITRDTSRFLRQGIIQQKLDHFDDSNETLWQMRFLNPGQLGLLPAWRTNFHHGRW